ncbi:MAG: hypothetical protein ACOCP8_00035 [archaeon]
MKYAFNKQEIIKLHLDKLKLKYFENKILQKCYILFNIWGKQKELIYLFDKIEVFEGKETKLNIKTGCQSGPMSNKYHEQYEQFLMENNLFFLTDCENDLSIINLIYYYLLNEIKEDKNYLSVKY